MNLEELMLVNRRFENKLNNTTLLVVGCGGTGSLFIRDAMRVVNVYNEKAAREVSGRIDRVIFADADILEEKNLIRQNFIRQDIGRNKAQVLAERYGSAFGIEIEVLEDFIENEEHLYNILVGGNSRFHYFYRTNFLIFSMVDNVKTRLMMSNFLNGHYENSENIRRNVSDTVLVDSGNSEYAGQVVVSASNSSTSSFYLPTVAQLQPDLLNPANWDKFASEASCEESAVSDPQTISANATAANICVNILYNLLFQGGINYNKVVFNSQTNSTDVSYLRRNNHVFRDTIGKICYNGTEQNNDEVVNC